MSTNDPEKGLQVDENDGNPLRGSATGPSEASKSSEPAESENGSDQAGLKTAAEAVDTYALAQTTSINRLDSRYTEASEGAETVSVHDIAGKQKWTERLNPLKRKRKPPVPRDREVSREYNAGFFSKLTFHWMAPLMKVYYIFYVIKLHHRSLTTSSGRLPASIGAQ